MAEIFEKKTKKTTKKTNFKITRKNTLKSVKMKNSKLGLRHVLSGPKLCLESKFNDPGTFGCFGEHEQTHTHHHDTIPKCHIFKMAAATIFDTDLFVKCGAWHHTYLIMMGSEEL